MCITRRKTNIKYIIIRKMKAVKVFQDKTNIQKIVKKTMKESIHHKLPTEALLDKENVKKLSLKNSNTEVINKSTVDKKDLKDLTKNDKIEVEKNIESANPESEKCIIAEDLTSKKPRIEYYKKLVEHRNKLLNAALAEKEILKEKNELLMEENKSLKEALISATDVIDTLNGILEDEFNEKEEKVNESSNTSDIKTEIDESVSVPAFSNTDVSSEPFPNNDSTLVHDSDDSIVQ